MSGDRTQSLHLLICYQIKMWVSLNNFYPQFFPETQWNSSELYILHLQQCVYLNALTINMWLINLKEAKLDESNKMGKSRINLWTELKKWIRPISFSEKAIKNNQLTCRRGRQISLEPASHLLSCKYLNCNTFRHCLCWCISTFYAIYKYSLA